MSDTLYDHMRSRPDALALMTLADDGCRLFPPEEGQEAMPQEPEPEPQPPAEA